MPSACLWGPRSAWALPPLLQTRARGRPCPHWPPRVCGPPVTRQGLGQTRKGYSVRRAQRPPGGLARGRGTVAIGVRAWASREGSPESRNCRLRNPPGPCLGGRCATPMPPWRQAQLPAAALGLARPARRGCRRLVAGAATDGKARAGPTGDSGPQGEACPCWASALACLAHRRRLVLSLSLSLCNSTPLFLPTLLP